MQDKNGCLGCHFLSLFSFGRDGPETNPLPGEFRNRVEFSKLIQKLDRRKKLVKCSDGCWDAAKIGIEDTAGIESAAFRKDRGKKCPLFSPYDSIATSEAVKERNRRKEEVIDRKVTSRLAWTAIIISALATVLSAILPILFSSR